VRFPETTPDFRTSNMPRGRGRRGNNARLRRARQIRRDRQGPRRLVRQRNELSMEDNVNIRRAWSYQTRAGRHTFRDNNRDWDNLSNDVRAARARRFLLDRRNRSGQPQQPRRQVRLPRRGRTNQQIDAWLSHGPNRMELDASYDTTGASTSDLRLLAEHFWFGQRTARNWQSVENRRRAALTALLGDPNANAIAVYNEVDTPTLQRLLTDLHVGMGQFGAPEFLLIESRGSSVGGGSTFYTLNRQNVTDTLNVLTDYEEVPEDMGSDTRIVDILLKGEFAIYRPGSRAGSVYQSHYQEQQGRFLPYLHKFKDPELQEILERYGLFYTCDEKNYETNCLVKAMELSEVPDYVIEHFKVCCRRRTIPRKKLAEVAQTFNIYIEISTDTEDHLLKYGDPSNPHVRLGLFHNHYIFRERTPVTGFALDAFKEKNPILYKNGELKRKWWTIKDSKGRKDAGKGIDSKELVKRLVNGDFLEPMDLTTEGMFNTQFVNQVQQTYKTMDFPEEAVRPYHPPRFAIEGAQDEELAQYKKAKGMMFQRTAEHNKWKCRANIRKIEEKAKKHGWAVEEKTKAARKMIPSDYTIFADFETTTDGDIRTKDMTPEELEELDPRETLIHKPYLMSYAWREDEDFDNEDDEPEIHTIVGRECGLEFLEDICNEVGVDSKSQTPVVTILCHNATYDASFLMPYITGLQTIERGTSIISLKGYFEYDGLGMEIRIKDTLKMIPNKLAQFGSMFRLDVVKEIMPYCIYTSENIDLKNGLITIAEAEQNCNYEGTELDEFRSNYESWDCVTEDGHLDLIKYSSIYCEMDVKVLYKGWEKFRELCMKALDMDPDYYLTLPALADCWMTENGGDDGIWEVSGVVQHYCKQANRGGRTMCAYNKKRQFYGKEHPRTLEERLQTAIKFLMDFDAVSLYPSAIAMLHFPRGPPKVIKHGFDPSSYTYYIITILITKVGKHIPFPCVCLKTPEGGNNWTNDLEGKIIIVDQIQLEDLVEFQEIEYEFVQGLYWDDGVNTKAAELIKYAFQQRLDAKAETPPNPIEMIWKLVMNTIYGKKGQKAIEEDLSYVEADRLNHFLHNHHASVSQVENMPKSEVMVKQWKPIVDDFNRQHISVMILSMSKRIMNRVLSCCPDPDQALYYTDTDSIHIEEWAIPEMAATYQAKYGTPLIGKGLGQFHSDFDFAGCQAIELKHDDDGEPYFKIKTLGKGDYKTKGEIKSEMAVFIGKKAYFDRIVDTGNPEFFAYHMRLKGVPEKVLIHKIETKYGGRPEFIYDDLYDGEPVTFHLGENGHAMFKTLRNHNVVTTSIKRTLQFKQNTAQYHDFA